MYLLREIFCFDNITLVYIELIHIMSFTRFHDDPLRISKQLQEITGTGRYMLDTPGPGINLPFFEDTHLRLQGWGANLQTNTVNLESELIGLGRPLSCDATSEVYTKYNVVSTQPAYSSANPSVEETRASHPAWMYRDLEHPRWEEPWINPQAHVEKRFQDNVQTRILEKDYYKPRVPVLWNTTCTDQANEHIQDDLQYYAIGRTMCIPPATVR